MCKKVSFIVLLIVLLTSCANVVNVKECLPMETPSGFWEGTWHGIIAGPAFFASLIWDDIAVYAINNNGAWYNFGFVGGLFTILKGIGLTVKRVKR